MSENPSGKVQAMLAALISQTRASDLDQPIQVVVGTAAGASGASEVIQRVRELGGELLHERESAVECRIPMECVLQLAESPAVSYVRLARLHSIS